MFEYRKSSNVGNVPEIIQVPAKNAEVYVVGEALKLADGVAVKAAGTFVPEYICAEKKTAKTGERVSAYLVEHNQEYESVTSADGSLVVGTKYTIDSDGVKVTATATNGVAEVVSVAGTTAGSKVVVRF